MSRSYGVPLLILGVLLAGLAFTRACEEPAPPAVSDVGVGSAATPSPESVTEPSPDPSLSAPAEEPTPPTPSVHWQPATPRSDGSFWGHVIWSDDSSPVEGARVSIEPLDPPSVHPLAYDLGRSIAIPDEITNAEGHFRVTGVPEGSYRLAVTHPSGARTTAYAAATPEESDALVFLDRSPQRRPIALTVRLLDEAGAPAPGATVRVWTQPRSLEEQPTATLTTDEHGETSIAPLADHAVIEARLGQTGVIYEQRDRGLLQSHLSYDRTTTGEARPVLVLTLAPLATLRGTIALPPGDDVRATVLLTTSAWRRSLRSLCAVRRQTPVDAAGRFEVQLPAGTVRFDAQLKGEVEGTWRLVRRAGDAVRPVVHRNSIFFGEIDLEPGETRTIEAEFLAGARVEGVVRSAGTPVPNAMVRLFLPGALHRGSHPHERGGAPLARLDDPSGLGEAHPLIAPMTRTDAAGRYRFDGLIGSDGWEIDVYADGLSHDRRADLDLVDGETVTLEHDLEPAGVVEGIVWELASIGLRRVGETTFRASFIAPDQSVAPFSVPGLAPGSYEFYSLHSNVSVEPIFLAAVEVLPHRVTWIDLRNAPPYELRGQVRFAGAPRPNALVDFSGRPVVTAPNGRFGYPFAQRRANGIGITVVAPMIPDAVPVEYARRYDPERDPYWNEVFDLPAGSLELTLAGPDGSPVEGQVAIRPTLNSDQQVKWSAFRTNPPDEGLVRAAPCRRRLTDGRVRFALLPPGRYAIELFQSRVVFTARTVQVEANEPTVKSITLELGGRVEVRVVDAEGQPRHDASVYLTYGLGTAKQRSFYRTVDADGYATFEHAPPGDAIVSLTRGGFGVWVGKQEVTVDPEVPTSVVIEH